MFGAVVLQALSDPVPAAIAVAAQFPLVAVAPFVPAGVPPLVALVVSDAPANVGTLEPPVGHAIAPSVNAPLAFVGTPTGQEIAPSVKPPPEFDPDGVPPLTALVVSLAPVNACAAAVKELTVSAGTEVLDPVKVCAAAVREFTVSAGTDVLDPVNVCAAAVNEFTVCAAAVRLCEA